MSDHDFNAKLIEDNAVRIHDKGNVEELLYQTMRCSQYLQVLDV